MAACGLSFNGINDKGKPMFDGNQCTKSNIILLYHPNEVFNAWNMSIVRFAKNYIYIRLLAPGEKAEFKTKLLTYMFSA
jgi:D-alanyl-lipoteichoic acid acyltransferase DltB (MBOAT superfamily)